MIVEVIADIPAAQVNRSFDYLVPEEMAPLVELGMRVQIPFGPRQLMGIIIKIKEVSDFEGKLKSVTALLDYESFLSAELIELSEAMAKDLNTFRITVLQAMLPSLLKVKYESYFLIEEVKELARALSIAPEAIETDRLERYWLEGQLRPVQIRDLLKRQVIKPLYQVMDQKRTKYQKYLVPAYTPEDYQSILAQLDKRSRRQGQVLALYSQDQVASRIKAEDLAQLAQVSPATLTTLVKKGWLKEVYEEVYRPSYQEKDYRPSFARPLLPSQQAAFDQIKAFLNQHQEQTFLIEGVTGSGKTEVYLQLIAQALEHGRSAILLVPEIALTPQMVERVVSRFGEGVALLHSGLSVSEKYDEWRRILRQEAQVVVGARSSIFAPLKNIGLIIIDEEHESTYKQSDNPRYHAREVAIWRSSYHQCPLVLGSATPSLESRARAQVGNYQLVEMKERIHQRPLPPVTLVDMTQEALDRQEWAFSPLLQERIADKIAAKEQVVLLLNRRGYAAYLLCRSCGYVIQCPRCDISLTYHKQDQSLKCHYCDYHQPLPSRCPQCGSQHLRHQGMGTQKIAESLMQLFPGTPVIRMDNDTTRRKGAHKQLLEEFASQPGSILLGTQMIAKGLDYENVTLVGVINADTGLHLPDFRAAEKTFQILTQVAGRTGRGNLPGEVIIQTYNPDHYVLQFAQHHDYEQFFYYEMKRRHLGQYPPYFYTSLIKIHSKNRGQAIKTSYELKESLIKQLNKDVIILGPTSGGLEKINNQYHFQLLLKYKQKKEVNLALEKVLQFSQEELAKNVSVQIDHEPHYFI